MERVGLLRGRRLHAVDGLDVAGQTACGTFTFTASDGGTTVTATSGTFALPLSEIMP